MLASLAWKNVWRNKRRSAIMITAIALGLWGGLFSVGMMSGMYEAMVSSRLTGILLTFKCTRKVSAMSIRYR